MLSLHVLSDNLDFLTYLSQESTYHAEKDAYLFSSAEQASRVISRYVLYYLKEIHLSSLIQEVSLPPEDKSELLLYLPSEKMAKIFHFINQKILIFLSGSSSFHFEGFIRFRLSIENEMLAKFLWIAYYEYLEYSSEPSNIDFLKTFVSEQPCTEERVSVICDEEGLTIQGKETVYLEKELEEDTMLSHLALISPQFVDVYEYGRSISPTFTIILTELFGKRVMFHGLADGTSSHKKKER